MRARIIASLLAVSAAGITAIYSHEGQRLAAYIPVPGDVPTIGVGATTYEDGSRVKLGDVITPERSKRLLEHHVKSAERGVIKCAPVPMTQDEFDVFVGFYMNVGGGKAGVKDGFCVLKNGSSTTMRKHLLAGRNELACAELLKWANFQGRPLKGLVMRREAEYKRCMGGKV